MNNARRLTQTLALAALLAACATSPTGRNQLLLMSPSQMDQMGATAYGQIKEQQTLSQDTAARGYVECVTSALTAEVKGGQWEVNLFADPSANAFALPGGKIGVNEGLLKVAESQDQLAAVIGHEIGHVLAQHSNERMSIQFATQTGSQLLYAASGEPTPEKQLLFAALGVGAQLGLQLPFSRKHESESDLIGLELMAKAGFKPGESVALWQNMAKNSAGSPPEWLSTHPAHGTRIEDLRDALPRVLPLYEKARAAGKRPACKK